MRPYFSIIVPVYNVEKQVKICVESLIDQSYRDFEILLIDDGSVDNSGVICDVLATVYSVVKCYHKTNGGLSDARNYGIEHAIGKYFLFIDSDDVVDKDFCKVLHDAHEKYSADIVSTDIVPFYNYEELDKLKKKTHVYSENFWDYNDILKEYFAPSSNRKIMHGLCMKSYNSELFKNLRFERGRLHEDLFITYQLLDKCRQFVFINLPFYYYYQNNENSITRNYGVKNFVDECDALNNIILYFSGRQELKDELIYFINYHYFFMVKKCCRFLRKRIKLKSQKNIKRWLFFNIWKCKKLDILRRAYYYTCVMLPRLYLCLNND